MNERYETATDYFNFQIKQIEKVDEAYQTVLMKQREYQQLISKNKDFRDWTRTDLLYGQYGQEAPASIEDTPDWSANLDYIFAINLLNRSNIEIATVTLYSWLEQNKPAYKEPATARLLQPIDDYDDQGEYGEDSESDEADKYKSDSTVNCTEQTYDLRQIYDNYVLVHSKNNPLTMKYVPLLDRIIAWMDLTYGFN